MNENITETIAVAEAGIKRLKNGREALNITADDGRVFGSVREPVIEEGRPHLSARFVELDYTERARGEFVNRYIVAVRKADEDAVEALDRKPEPAAATSIVPPVAAVWTDTAQREAALTSALRYLELRGPAYIREVGQPTTTELLPTVAEVTTLADKFLAYLKREAPHGSASAAKHAAVLAEVAAIASIPSFTDDGDLPEDLLAPVARGPQGEEVWS